MYRAVDDHFLEHPCGRGQKRDNDPEQGQLFFVSQGSVSFIDATFDFWTFCKMTSLRVSLLSGFPLGRFFQIAKFEYDLVLTFGLPKPLGLCNVNLFLQLTVSPTLSGFA